MRKKYGTVYSMKVGSFKLAVAEDADSVMEVLVKRSADYAGRPPFHFLQAGFTWYSMSIYTTLYLVFTNAGVEVLIRGT